MKVFICCVEIGKSTVIEHVFKSQNDAERYVSNMNEKSVTSDCSEVYGYQEFELE